MKILIVGFGSIGKRHAQNILQYTNNDIVILTKRKKIPSINGKSIKFFNSLDLCLKECPELALITNETSLHIKFALKIAKKGIPLFIEKPLSNSMTDVLKLEKLVNEKKIFTYIGCNLRFHSCIKKIKSLLEKNSIGRVISVQVECGSYLPDWHPYEDYKKSYASRDDLGGGVVLTCIHEIDYLYWFFGMVNEICSITGSFSNLDITASDLSAIILKFKNNIIGEIHLDYFQKFETRSCKIIGTTGIIYWDSQNNLVKIFDNKKNLWINKYKLEKYDKNQEYVEELKHVLKCIKNKSNSINDISQGIDTLRIALSAIKASERKKFLRIL